MNSSFCGCATDSTFNVTRRCCGVAIPYGLLSSGQLRLLGSIARRYDRGYGHFTTRQNIQYNWPKLEQVPDILAELAEVEMHAIQTSGNCIRNVTSDHLAGVAADELEDPRPWCEIIRQWSTFHPEFSFLPRKFKIAVTGAPQDRAASLVHDVGVHIVRGLDGEIGFEILAGGGLGRTPIIGQTVRSFLPRKYLLSYLEAILRVYNLEGAPRQLDQSAHKNSGALVGYRGIQAASRGGMAAAARQRTHPRGFGGRTHAGVLRSSGISQLAGRRSGGWKRTAFRAWYRYNTVQHKVAGYRAVFISLKKPDVAPGDATDAQMELVCRARRSL